MGCASSTEVVTDHTGAEQKKKKLGGAYPGQRRPQHQTYVPPTSEFDHNGQAVAHFVAYGGGNALTLVQQDGSAHPQSGKAESQFVQVTLPSGVSSGQTIHVQAPDGQVNAIVIPAGFGPGSTFTVEFAPEGETSPQCKTNAVPPSSGQTQNTSTGDDGFATSFGNPNSRPPPTTVATAVPASEPEISLSGYGQNNEADIDLGAYPTTSATPVYSSAPQYPSK